MKTKKHLLINLLSTFILVAILTACNKDKIDTEGIPDAGISDQLYKEKLQSLVTSNNSKARELGIQTAVLKQTIQADFKSYREAYEFFAALKKGITSTKTDSAVVSNSSNKNLSTLAVSSGVDNAAYSIYCANSCGVSGTVGVGSIAADWSVSGTINYYWTQNGPTAPKQYKSIQPSTANCSDPIYAYSGIGSMSQPTGGGWNGSVASYYCEKNVQIEYSVGTSISYFVKVRITANIGWTPTPQTAWVSHTMTATAY